MPKRYRDDGNDEAKGVHVESSLESGRRFDAYIRGWVQETIEPRLTRPSSLPPLTPLPTLLSSTVAPHGCDTCEVLRSADASPVNCFSLPVAHSAFSESAIVATTKSTVAGTGVVYDATMLEHVSPDATDYERPARLRTTLDHLTAIGLLSCCQCIPARTAKTKELRRVHTREHVDTIDQLDFFMGIRDEKRSIIGQDLFACEHTSRAARMAAGCVIEAARAVINGTCANAFALVRPPGHHAGAGNAAGFCLYNNVAVAARAAQEELMAARQCVAERSGCSGDCSTAAARPRVLILDWDVHHCDGTESVFYDDPSVLVISIHQYGKGCGHVLRKTPSTELSSKLASAGVTSTDATTTSPPAANKEDIDVSDLAALLDMPDVQHTEPAENIPRAADTKEAPADAADAAPPPDTAAVGRRARKPVDYNKLAAELQDDGSDDIAALFGVDVAAISSSSISSSSSSYSSATSRSKSQNPAHVHYAGDTVGLSFDEEGPQVTQEGGEEPFYPGTGHMNRVGGETAEEASGRNINIPWPTHDMGDLEYLRIMHELVLPVAQEFQPAVVFISSGFDSARGDLLGSMSISPSGFYLMTHLMATHFPRLVVALEGGYNVRNVALGAEAVLRALLECSRSPANQLPKTRMLWHQAGELVKGVKTMHAPYWKCFSSGAAPPE
jgi:acetoin utilization deacetylase AcuC-like enzyme